VVVDTGAVQCTGSGAGEQRRTEEERASIITLEEAKKVSKGSGVLREESRGVEWGSRRTKEGSKKSPAFRKGTIERALLGTVHKALRFQGQGGSMERVG